METTETRPANPITQPETPRKEIRTCWDYSRFRIASLCRSRAVQIEFGVLAAMLLALLANAFPAWRMRWTLEGSPQGYAVWIPPILLAWLYVHRLKWIVPELDSLSERFTEGSVVRFLLEERPEPVKRLKAPLLVACLLTPLAYWIGEATFTGFAFFLLVVGIIGFRLGTPSLRVAAFPLTLFALMIPLPGILTDFLGRKLQVFFFKVTLHLLQIMNANAEMPPESNPLWMLGQPRYEMYAGQVGVGLAEAGLFLLLTLAFFTVLAIPFRFKIIGFLIALIWGATLITLRLAFLAYMGSQNDAEMLASLIPFTRWMLPVVGMAGQLLFMRGLHRWAYREWVFS